MATFTVHEPPMPAPDRVDRADELAFVNDGFSWPTAIFPPLGFLAAGLWPWALAYLLGVSILSAALSAINVGPLWIGLIMTALNIYLAFELSTIKRWVLDRQGWRTVGTVTGKTLDECERRFMESWLPEQPAMLASARDDQTTRGVGGQRGLADFVQRFTSATLKS